MKAYYSARVITVFLICISLLTACAGIKSILPGTENSDSMPGENENFKLMRHPQLLWKTPQFREKRRKMPSKPRKYRQGKTRRLTIRRKKRTAQGKGAYLTGWTAGSKEKSTIL